VTGEETFARSATAHVELDHGTKRRLILDIERERNVWWGLVKQFPERRNVVGESGALDILDRP